jgi:hypothetical protein
MSKPTEDSWQWLPGAMLFVIVACHAQPAFAMQAPAWLPARTIELGSYAMAYDLARQRVVLCVGRGDTNSIATDVWEWDGVLWSRRPAAGVSPGGASTRSPMT